MIHSDLYETVTYIKMIIIYNDEAFKRVEE
jgi:hypothetical protein